MLISAKSNDIQILVLKQFKLGYFRVKFGCRRILLKITFLESPGIIQYCCVFGFLRCFSPYPKITEPLRVLFIPLNRLHRDSGITLNEGFLELRIICLQILPTFIL